MRKTEINFKLFCSIRTRFNKASKSQNIQKTNKSSDIIGCSHSFFNRWFINRIYGKST